MDPSELPISRDLVGDLMRWAREYDETLDRQDPMASGFAGDKDEAEFYERGRGLARRLGEELSGQYAVEYFDGRTGRVFPVAS